MTTYPITIEYLRFKPKNGKFYDSGEFTVYVDYNLLVLPIEERGKLYYEMHSNILPQATKYLAKYLDVVVIRDDSFSGEEVIGYPYMRPALTQE